MRIRRKEIIERIIGEGAKKRGFSLEYERKHSTFWLLVFIKRSGTGQFIEIREDFEEPGKISLMRVYKKNYDLFYHDEESFAEAIQKFQEKLEEDGYAILDEKLNQPALCKEDYVYNHYEELSNKFCLKHKIDLLEVSFNEGIDIVEQEITSIMDESWENIRTAFCEVTAFYVELLLKVSNTIFYQHKEKVFYVERTAVKHNMVAVMPLLFTALKGNARKKIVRGFTDLLLPDEVANYGIKYL